MKLTKVQGDPQNPGEWRNLAEDPEVHKGFAERYPIVLCCPQCGKQCSVSAQIHTVTSHEDGTFTAHPSFVCPHKPCTWHVFINRSEY